MNNSKSSNHPAGPSRQPEKIQSMFSDIAPVYDRLNRFFSLRVDVLWRSYASKNLVRPSDRMILDIACGSGDLTDALSKKATSACQVTGLDFCGPLLTQARGKRSDLDFLKGDGLCLPFPDETFDLVTVAFGLRNMASTTGALKEMSRILKPGGRLGVLEFTKPNNALVAGFNSLYSEKILPVIGDFVSGTKAYSYLNQSVKEWPDAPELKAMMKNCGYQPVRFEYLHMRNAALHTGVKPLNK